MILSPAKQIIRNSVCVLRAINNFEKKKALFLSKGIIRGINQLRGVIKDGNANTISRKFEERKHSKY